VGVFAAAVGVAVAQAAAGQLGAGGRAGRSVAVLAMGDLSARRSAKAPGGFHPGAAAADAASVGRSPAVALFLQRARAADLERSKLLRHFSPAIADAILAQEEGDEDPLGASIRDEVTVLFSDIQGFTKLTERLPVLEMTDLLRDYFREMTRALFEEKGTLDKLIGDGLMAIFGAPLPRDDHRQRAVLAARQMVDLIRLFNEEQAARDKVQIQIGVGIASGRVVAGYTGTQRRATYTCVGDTVNIAARLESHTKVVQRPILIDEHTRRGLDDGIAVEAHGELLMKGKTEPVKVYAVHVDSLVAESA
jgi:class 3 adenylate cyclase